MSVDYSGWLRKHQELNEKLKNEIKPFNPVEVITAKRGRKIKKTSVKQKQKQKQSQSTRININIGDIKKKQVRRKRKPKFDEVLLQSRKNMTNPLLPLMYSALSNRTIVMDAPPINVAITQPPNVIQAIPSSVNSVQAEIPSLNIAQERKTLKDSEKEFMRMSRQKKSFSRSEKEYKKMLSQASMPAMSIPASIPAMSMPMSMPSSSSSAFGTPQPIFGPERKMVEERKKAVMSELIQRTMPKIKPEPQSPVSDLKPLGFVGTGTKEKPFTLDEVNKLLQQKGAEDIVNVLKKKELSRGLEAFKKLPPKVKPVSARISTPPPALELPSVPPSPIQAPSKAPSMKMLPSLKKINVLEERQPPMSKAEFINLLMTRSLSGFSERDKDLMIRDNERFFKLNQNELGTIIRHKIQSGDPRYLKAKSLRELLYIE